MIMQGQGRIKTEHDKTKQYVYNTRRDILIICKFQENVGVARGFDRLLSEKRNSMIPINIIKIASFGSIKLGETVDE